MSYRVPLLSCGAVFVTRRFLAVPVEYRLVSDRQTTMAHTALAWRRAVKIAEREQSQSLLCAMASLGRYPFPVPLRVGG